MLIKGLTRKGKSILVKFDDNSELKLSEEIVVKNGLRRNDDLSESQIESLIKDNELILIKTKAFDLLSRRLHSAGELKRKLLIKKYSNELIDKVIEELIQKKYLNDEEYAKLFCEEKILRKKKGISIVRKELIKKGINKEIIDRAINSFDDELLYENALEIAEKKLKFLHKTITNELKMKNKLHSFLISRGNNYEIINKVMQTLFPN